MKCSWSISLTGPSYKENHPQCERGVVPGEQKRPSERCKELLGKLGAATFGVAQRRPQTLGHTSSRDCGRSRDERQNKAASVRLKRWDLSPLALSWRFPRRWAWSSLGVIR